MGQRGRMPVSAGPSEADRPPRALGVPEAQQWQWSPRAAQCGFKIFLEPRLSRPCKGSTSFLLVRPWPRPALRWSTPQTKRVEAVALSLPLSTLQST